MAPSMARPIMGAPFRLVPVTGALGTATGGITFGGSARWGAFARIRSSGGITFGGVGNRSARQVIFSSGGLTFGGSALLLAAGKPLIVRAVPETFTVQAAIESYAVTAQPEEYVVRGVAHE